MSDKHDRNWNRYVKTKGPHFESDIYEDTEKGVGTDQHIQHSMATDGDGSSIHNLQLLGTVYVAVTLLLAAWRSQLIVIPCIPACAEPSAASIGLASSPGLSN